jgi:hypothetical protein
MNEHGFIKAVHRHLSPEVYRWKIHDTYTGGVPDAFYMGPAGSLWVEYKYIKLPKRESTIINFGLSKLQVAWLTRAHMCGQLVAVIIGFDSSAIALTAPKSFSGMTQRELQDEAVSFQQIAMLIENHVTSRGYERGTNSTPSSQKPATDLGRKKGTIRT